MSQILAQPSAQSHPVQVSIIMPAFNEEAGIASALEAVVKHVSARWSFEVIVVDDGSSDHTATAVSRYAVSHPEIRLIGFASNRGKGAAVREGVLAARGRLVCFLDADLAIPIGQIDRLVELLDARYDVVIASRALPESFTSPQPSLRRLMSGLFNWLVRVLFGLPFRDTQCGFKGLRRDAALAAFRRMRMDSFAFDVELLVAARRLGYAIGEMPIRVEQSRLSTVSLAGHGPAILRDLWRIASRMRAGAYDASSQFA